jgi:thiosulfate sulfurtransferase
MEFKRIDVRQARALLDAAPENGLQIIDIRDEQSYVNGHMSSALHIDNSNVQPFVENANTSKPLLVYCYHGNMSQSAAAYFGEQGFEEAYSMDVVLATGRSTLRIRSKLNSVLLRRRIKRHLL